MHFIRVRVQHLLIITRRTMLSLTTSLFWIVRFKSCKIKHLWNTGSEQSAIGGSRLDKNSRASAFAANGNASSNHCAYDGMLEQVVQVLWMTWPAFCFFALYATVNHLAVCSGLCLCSNPECRPSFEVVFQRFSGINSSALEGRIMCVFNHYHYYQIGIKADSNW